MAGRPASLPPGTRLSDLVAVGVLARTVPLASVMEALTRCEKTSLRERELPAHVVVYYVMALGLYMHCACREVLRCLLEGIRWLHGPETDGAVAGDSGISQARTRLGWEPLQQLHDQLVRPLATAKTRGAWYRQWRLVSLDGSTLAVPDTQRNAQAFGRPRNHRGQGGYEIAAALAELLRDEFGSAAM